MKKIWIRAILPVLTVATVVACGHGGGDDDGTPVNRAHSTAPAGQEPVVTDTANGNNKSGDKKTTLPDSDGVSEVQKPKQQQKPSGDSLLTGDENRGNEDRDEADSDSDSASSDEGNTVAPETTQEAAVGGGVMDPGSESQVAVAPVNPIMTGAGNDDLRQYLTEAMNAETNAAQKEKNAAFTQSIQSVRARVDVLSSQAVVTVMSSRSTTPLILTGPMSQQGRARLSSRLNVISGDMTCLDLDANNCQTSLLRLREHGSKPGFAFVIIRHTNADARLSIPKDRKGTNDFLRLVDLFANTQGHTGSPNSLREIIIQSFEVINGASGMKVSIISRENQLITGSAPLIGASDGSKLTNVVMNRDLNLEDLVEVERHEAFKTDLNQAISEMRLVENDGVGNIAILIRVNGSQGQPARLLKVGLMRIAVPMVPSAQIEKLVQN